MRVCILAWCTCVAFHGMCLCRVEQTGRAAKYGATKGPAVKKSSTLCSQSSLLAIYNVLHYITIPLALGHLHIPVTSSQRLLIINGSHMLPGVPHYGVNTKKPRKMEIISTQNEAQKTIRGSAFIDSVSAPLIERVSFGSPGCGASLTSVGGSTICRLHFSDNFFVYANELDSDGLLYKLVTLKEKKTTFFILSTNKIKKQTEQINGSEKC